MTNSLPSTFQIAFPSGQTATALRVPTFHSAVDVASILNIPESQPTMFISGGASAMDDSAIARTRDLIKNGIVRFAVENNVVIVDGGTNAGIMQMVGQAAHELQKPLTLIGCAPEGKVTFPGSAISGDKSRTDLEPNHTHFVLVDADYWGAESDMIVGLTRAITGGGQPNCGILINGGSIAKYDIYIASARGDSAMPVMVVDGSGRSADEIALASRTGNFTSAMIKAIVEGGNIQEVSLKGGAEMIHKRLKTLFNIP